MKTKELDSLLNLPYLQNYSNLCENIEKYSCSNYLGLKRNYKINIK